MYASVSYSAISHICSKQSLALTQIGAVLVSLIEAKVKKEKVTSQSKIAVVPGLCVVVLGILLYGICVRMGVIA